METPTGQFTQEDPIGIAGGLDLYGYAGGDPVNFSDPFGLCPDPESCIVQGSLLGGAVGTGIGVLVAGGCALTTGGVCTAGSGAIIGVSAGFGASVGGFIGTIAGSDLDGSEIVHSAGEKVRRWIRALGLAGGLIFPGPEPTGTVDPTPVDPGAPIEAPAPRPAPTDTISGGRGK